MQRFSKISVVTAVATVLSAIPAVLPVTAQAATTRYEVESAPAVCGGAVASNHSGYSGSGFCDTPNAAGSTVQFTVNAPAAGTATLDVRYANGSTANRPADLSVNGAVVRPGFGFEATGAWNAWATKSLTVQLTAGNNTVRLAATTAGGLGNMDYLDVTTGSSATYAGYLFTYFTGEGTTDGEQVYFGLSQGNDPTRWRQLNGGRPVLTSSLGTRGVRDPFIIRSPQGDRFYQIATDLRIFGNGNWDAAQRTGSKSIVVWESTDLVNWSAPRLQRVSPDTAGNTWAPEAVYDANLGQYVVFWASKLYSTSDPNHTGSSFHRMMYATTSDFRTFSAAQVWVDKGFSTIDSTLIRHNATYYRLTKDERSSSQSTCGNFILEEKSTTLLNRGYSFVAECIGRGTISRGEGPLVFKSNTEERWYLFIDEFGGRGYIPFTTTNLDSGQWTAVSGYTLPGRPRHGTVLPVTQAEYDRLLQRWG